jgi:peptidoglycan/xylan/chitin deacetylase (PgdA/CDA1 family)
MSGSGLLPAGVLLAGAEAVTGVTWTVDVDCSLGEPPPSADRCLSWESEGRFGVTRGVPRLLELFGDLGVTATFYVPGVVATTYPDLVGEVAAAGHEIGLHGHRHIAPALLSPGEQLEELRRGGDAVRGRAPTGVIGYRAPDPEHRTVGVDECHYQGSRGAELSGLTSRSCGRPGAPRTARPGASPDSLLLTRCSITETFTSITGCRGQARWPEEKER